MAVFLPTALLNKIIILIELFSRSIMANTPKDRIICFVDGMDETLAFQPKRRVSVKRTQNKTATRVRDRHSTMPKSKSLLNKNVIHHKPKQSLLNKGVKTLLNPVTPAAKLVVKKPTTDQINKWNIFSRRQQIEYLKEHPNSIFKEVPLNKENSRESDKTTPTKLDGGGNIAKHRLMSTGERKQAIRNVEALAKNGALNLGSKQRENCATLLDRDGADSIKESLKPDEIEQLLGEYKEVRHSKSIRHKLSTTPRIKPDDKPGAEAPDEDEEEPKPLGKHHHMLAYVLGGLVAAALLGVALASVSPTAAMFIGYHVVNQLPDVISNIVRSDFTLANATDEDLQEIAGQAANYLRDGKLPLDLVKKLKYSIGV
jgi:hypothetical protein